MNIPPVKLTGIRPQLFCQVFVEICILLNKVTIAPKWEMPGPKSSFQGFKCHLFGVASTEIDRHFRCIFEKEGNHKCCLGTQVLN